VDGLGLAVMLVLPLLFNANEKLWVQVLTVLNA